MSISQSESEDWRRSEPRIPIDLGSAPFLGSRENGQPSFAYLLRDVSSSGVGVIVPLWTGMVPLEIGEAVNFHLPFQLNQRFYNQGVIRVRARLQAAIEIVRCAIQTTSARLHPNVVAAAVAGVPDAYRRAEVSRRRSRQPRLRQHLLQRLHRSAPSK